VSAEELAAPAPELVLVPSGEPLSPGLPALGGARAEVVPPELAAVALLDLAERVRTLHGVFYPAPHAPR
jgi:hypothetical protein